MPDERKGLSKKIRFEVFKRDSFKCQYCGRTAPEVLLVVDHVKPVSDGGTSDILNLVTACEDCNQGKGARRLDDQSAVEKQRRQLEQLQARREQLDMLMEWSHGLRSLQEEVIEQVCDYWIKLAPGRRPNELGTRSVKKWIRRFGVQEVLNAMSIAADHYLQFQKDGNVTAESWGHAWLKIPGICVYESAKREDPEFGELTYIRYVASMNCRVFYKGEALELLKRARKSGIPLDELRTLAREIQSWTQFKSYLLDRILAMQPKEPNERLAEEKKKFLDGSSTPD